MSGATVTQTPVHISASYNNSNQSATLTVNPGTPISHTGWSVIVDSQETSCYNGAGVNAVDGNPSTMWHTQFCGGSPATPHWIQINLGASYSLTGLQYLPRQDGCSHGWIKDYAIYVSSDGVNWGTPVASGTFNYGNLSTGCPGAGVPSALQVAFPATTGQYIQLRALSEINGNPWTSAAEIDVLGVALSTVTLNAPIVIGGSSVQGTVTLTAMAPAGGAVVTLGSDKPAAATPASGSVTVPAGQISATFTVNTSSVGTVTTVHISASYNNSNQSATLTVNLDTPISHTGWSASADSQQNVSSGCTLAFPATNAIDGNPNTLWHTQYCPTSPPLPHQITINLGASYSLTGLQYLPRQDGCSHGWIKQYAIYVSSDGVNWGTPVVSGTFNYGNLSTSCPGAGVPSALQVAFPATTGQYIQLRALSEINGTSWTSAAEINVLGALIAPASATVSTVTLNTPIVLGGSSVQGTVTLTAMAPAGGAVVSLQSDTPLVATVPASVTIPAGSTSATFPVSTSAVGAVTTVHIYASYNNSNPSATLTVNPGTPISHTGWSVIVDSQETSCYNGAGVNAVDGNPSTMWHTQFCYVNPSTPHQIQINLGASYSLTGLQYLPRQDGCSHGWIKDYAIYVSSDGVNWGTPVASGTFNYGNLSTGCPGAGVPGPITIAFPATTGQYIQLRALSEINGNPWTSAAEINVIGQ